MFIGFTNRCTKAGNHESIFAEIGKISKFLNDKAREQQKAELKSGRPIRILTKNYLIVGCMNSNLEIEGKNITNVDLTRLGGSVI